MLRLSFAFLLAAGILIPPEVGAARNPGEGTDAVNQESNLSSVDSSSWRAASSTVLVREDVNFRSGDIPFAGTLVLPENGENLAAVVVLHGASSPLRSSPLYRHLTETLPSLGIAVFLYDRRGAGESGGRREGASFEELADDGIAAIEMLRKDRRIDPDRLGVWGLSQGGWLSVLAASRSEHVKFAISISAPMVTPDVQMMFSSTNMLRVFGYSEDDVRQMRATRAAVDNYMRGTVDKQTALRAVAESRDEPWYKYLYMGDTVQDREVSGWRREIEHDPLATIKQVDTPLLVLYGATDPVVPVETSVERLAEVTPSHPDMEVFVVANADHHMQIGVDPRVLLDPEHDDEARPDSPEYIAIMSRWLTEHGIAQ